MLSLQSQSPPQTLADTSISHHPCIPSANFAESATQTIKLDYRGIIVGKIVEYLHFKHAYKDTAQKEITEDFSERIEPELALEL